MASPGSFSRRQLIATSAGFALSSYAAITAGSRETYSPLETFLRMRNSGARLTYWWYSGYVLGRIQGEPARPMLSVVGASYSRTTAEDDGTYRYDLVEAGYYGDPDSGEILDELPNPLTGEAIRPEHYLSPQSLRFHPDLKVSPNIAKPPEGLDFVGRITPPDVKHDRVWMAEELFVKLPNPSGTRIANSLANFEAQVEDVFNPALEFVPASLQYTTINSFRPWMNMGQTPGTVSMRLNGIKMASPEGLPSELVERIGRDHPGFWGLIDG